jgi:putative ABC transport system permease protein
VFALRGNWMRSALTSLGVIIGIAAVIVMVSVGQGTQREIDKLVSGLGSQRLDVSPGSRRGPGGARMSAGSFYTLTEGDVDAIRNEVPEVQYVAGALRGNTQVVYAENNASTSWQGVQPDWFAINDWKLAEGDGFDAQAYGSAAKDVVIGDTVRRTLFGDDSGIGQTIRLGRVPFTFVGTLEPKGQGGFGQDQDDVVMVPLETARRRLLGSRGLPPGAVMQIALTVGDARDLSYAQGEVEGLLRQRHKIKPGADDDFAVRNISEIVATRTATTNLMSKLLGAVATICLIIGGIGIMNIMLVSVTERIREIGLRMAVGAGPSDVRRQFLAEAMLISLIGGVIGIAIGVVGALLVGKFSELPVALNGQVVGLAAAFSIGTGLFFGYYPARKASQLDPIEALRQS